MSAVPPRPQVVFRSAANGVVVAAACWWVLVQLAPVLRPLLLAVFLAYVLLPYYKRLRTRLPAGLAVGLLAGLTTAVLVGLAFAVYGSLLSLSDDLPGLRESAKGTARRALDYWNRTIPSWVRNDTAKSVEEKLGELLTEATGRAVNAAAAVLLEAATAGLYLLFLLYESDHFPRRLRAATTPERAEQILVVAGRINAAIVSYLKAKVKSSLLLAAPVWLVLTVFGVKFALLWAILTFLCNFIPYLGSVISYSMPVAFAFLQYPAESTPILVAAGLLAAHVVSASVVEPTVIGRAVGLSPLVILFALSVWGLIWGLPGLFLAVPLTVVVKLACENIEALRPAARLVAGE